MEDPFTTLLVPIIAVVGICWTIASIALPFLVWGIYNRTKTTAIATERLADFFDNRNVEVSTPRHNPTPKMDPYEDEIGSLYK